MADQTITLTLPDDLYQRFQQHALLKQHSVAEDVLSLATNALAEDELPSDLRQQVAALSSLDNTSLRTVAQRRLTHEQEETVEELLFKQQREGLSSAERAELEQLRHAHDALMLMRATSLELLHDRGENIQSLLADPVTHA